MTATVMSPTLMTATKMTGHAYTPPKHPHPPNFLKPYPFISPNPYATLHLPLNPTPSNCLSPSPPPEPLPPISPSNRLPPSHTHTHSFPSFFILSLAVLLISLIPIICISIPIILLFYSVFHSSSILYHAHSNYFFFILFSIEITHPLVRGTHSLMRRVTSVAADAGAPVTSNCGGSESLSRGSGEGPVTAKSQGTWNAVKETGNGNWQPDISNISLHQHVNAFTC